MAKKDKIEAAVVSSDVAKSLQLLDSLKADIDTQAQSCLQIKVVDESTLAVCQQNLSKINQLKAVDAKRKELKDPYFQAGKLIDSTANKLIEEAEAAVTHLKNEVKEWELKKQKEAAEAQAELAKQAAEAAQKAADEEVRIRNIRGAIDKAKFALQQYYDGCKTIEFCDKAISDINTAYKSREFFQEFADEAYSLRDNYLELIKAKKAQLESANTMSAEEKALAEQKEQLAKERLELEAKAANIRAIEEGMERARQEKAEAERLAAEKAKMEAEAEMNGTRGIRKIWKVELVDKSKLIPDWILLDESAAKEYRKANESEIKDGDIINGVRFYQDISVSA